MMLLADWLHALGLSSIDWFWRPLLAWTLVGLPLYVGLRWWRSAPPLVQYHGYLALLLALPLGVALAPFVSWPASVPAAPVFAEQAPVLALPDDGAEAVALDPMEVHVAPMPAASPDVTGNPSHWIGLLTLIAACWAVLLLLRMAYLAHGLRDFRRRLEPVTHPLPHHLLRILADEVGVRDAVTLVATPDDTTPMTFGWRRPVIALPAALLDDEPALRLTLLHELIHIRRRDYVVSWVVRLVGSLFAIHPGVWLLRRHIDQYREISCDAETLGESPVPARQYVHLLLRFSPLTDLAGPAALRMVDLDSTLKKRISAMRTFVYNTSSARLRRWSLPLATTCLLIPALIAACATENHSSETVIVSSDADQPEQEIVVEEMAKHRASEAEAMEMAKRHVAEEQARVDAMRQEVLVRRDRERALSEQERALAEAEQRLKEMAELNRVREQERLKEDQFSEQALKRLAVQMEYLQSEIKKLTQVLTDTKQAGALQKQGEFDLTQQRLHLLNAMYMQRMEEFERMKMEQFTRAALEKMEG